MRDSIVGRKMEKAELEKIFNSAKAEFLAVCGRRRVGKTFLIKEYFEKELVFSVSGLAKANTQKQIKNFYSTLKLYDSSLTEKPNDWLDAFNLLIKYLTSLSQERKDSRTASFPHKRGRAEQFRARPRHPLPLPPPAPSI